jgi:hypothetical protein
MKNRKLLLKTLVLIGALSFSGMPAAAQGIFFKAQLPGTNYCHLKFPAIDEDTLYSDEPVLKNPNTTDIIDFYGPCDYDPVGKRSVALQKQHDYQARNVDQSN